MKLKDFKMKINSAIDKRYYLIYARKSSEDKNRQCQSIEDQLKAVNDLVLKNNYPILRIFKESRSAKQPGRPEFNAMLDLINKRTDIKGIIAWDMSRLSRNKEDNGKLGQLIDDKKVEEIITVTGRTYDGNESDYVYAVETAGNSEFIRTLRKNTKRGLDSKISKGIFPGLALPGYQNNTYKKQGERDISTHPVYFPLMKKIFDLALTGVFSIDYLTTEAKRLGLRNKYGNPIPRTTLAHLLRDPFYTGKFVYNGVLYQGTHQAMITEMEFDSLQEILSGRNRRKISHNDFDFRGIFECGNCNDRKMIVGMKHKKTYTNGNSQEFIHYTCSNRTNHHKGKNCNQPYIKEDEINKQVLNKLEIYELPVEFIDWALKWLYEENQDQRQLREAHFEALKKTKRGVENKIENLLDLRLSPLNKDGSLLNDEEFASRKGYLMNELSRINNQLEGAEQHLISWMDVCTKAHHHLASAREIFINGSPAKKKSILLPLTDLNLKIKDGKVDITLSEPFEKIGAAIQAIKKTCLLEPITNVATAVNLTSVSPSMTIWGG